ncbi:uncharacterized protein LOC124436616 [Xenia sp. Carnegie-2017]|uniref:uncharacterized protein LOC124436616 n=1 Tax=Xenia sp. Carnegie-2017 TaxID=2897299 RepID=UPI001F049B72|nr:uncharacterized protein LOC124436616 [Xenia sp. Carnegie-2017]
MIGNIFVIFSVITACNALKDACQSPPIVFEKLMENGEALAEKDIISSHVVRHLMECSMKCVPEQQCIGFNYLYSVQEHEINCQTSNMTISNVSKTVPSKGNWIFYQTTTKVLKQPCITKDENNWIALKDTSILKCKNDWILQLRQWLPSFLNSKKTVHCYQATVNGWDASTFHSRCDNKGQTLAIVKVGPYVFGGFASESWGGNQRYIRAERSFIFSLKNKDNLQPFKSDPSILPQYAMFTKYDYGPTFGHSHDLYIANIANSNSHSWTKWFGNSYKLPNGYTYLSDKTQNLLAGSPYFTPDEVEVFYFSS